VLARDLGRDELVTRHALGRVSGRTTTEQQDGDTGCDHERGEDDEHATGRREQPGQPRRWRCRTPAGMRNERLVPHASIVH